MDATSAEYTECVRKSIRFRKLHSRLARLGLNEEEMIHEVIVRTWVAYRVKLIRLGLTEEVPQSKLAMGTIAGNQLKWAILDLSEAPPTLTKDNYTCPDVIRPDFSLDARDMVDSLLGILSDIEREIVTLRYLKQQTLSQVANKVGLCVERVRQIEHSSLRKMRKLCSC